MRKFYSKFIKDQKILIICIVFFILILSRIALPYIIKEYAENQLNKIPEYQAKIKDIDVHLYRCSYTIKSIELWKIRKNIPVPFFYSEKVDFSLEWKEIFRGKFVAKIFISHPKINFVLDPNGKNEQLTISKQWIALVKSLFPLNINTVDIAQGEVILRSYTASPPFNIYLKNIFMQVSNMQNTEKLDIHLPSSFTITGNTMDEAKFSGQGKFNPFLKQPTFAINFSLKSMDIKYAANFLKHFTNVDIQSGKFSLFIEAVAKNGKISGYAKPFIKNLKININKNTNPLQQLYNGAADLFSKLLEDNKSKTIATKIKISGNVDDPDTSILSIIGYLLRHAFIQALIPQIDGSIKMQDLRVGEYSATKNKKKRGHMQNP